ncbi:MAG: 5'-nucleotidase C-terminal domain-containing protein [Nitrospinota bacterium]
MKRILESKKALFFTTVLVAVCILFLGCGRLEKDNEEEIQQQTALQGTQKKGAEVNPEIIGKTTFPLNTYYDDMALCEQGTGNMVADALKAAGVGAEMAFINAGSIRRRGVTGRTNIPVGDITMGDIILLFPFDNLLTTLNRARPSTVVLISLTGKVLKEVFENSFSRRLPRGPGTSFGRFLQVAGIEVHASALNPVGSRIIKLVLTSTGTEIDLNDDVQTYRAAIPLKYIKGTDRYSDFDQYWDIFAKGSDIVDTGIFIFDATVDFIKANSPLAYPSECFKNLGNRIIITPKLTDLHRKMSPDNSLKTGRFLA